MAVISSVAALAACSETPLDVITAAPGSGASGGLGTGGTGGESGDAAADGGPPTCAPAPVPVPGRYRVQQATSLRCLRVGAPTLLMGNPGYLAAVDHGCSDDPRAVWDLIAVASGRYQLRNVGVEMNLDIQYAGTLNGTPAVLYQSTTLRNQQFIFRPVGANRFEIAAAHAFNQCLSERLPQPEIWPCAEDPSQLWLLIPESCP